MKKMSILFSKKNLDIVSLEPSEVEYIYDYIDFLLSPYNKLGYFKYSTLADCCTPIDGKYSPALLLKYLSTFIASHVNELTALSFDKDNIFFNSESLKFSLSPQEYLTIQNNIEDYFLFFTLIHN